MSDPSPDRHSRVSSDPLGTVIDRLVELEEVVDDPTERQEVRRTRRMLERVPGGKRIQKYTTRDIAEGFIGGIIFSLPMLVEDGVFEIAAWFTDLTVGPIPLVLLFNVAFIVIMVTGLLYFTDIRDVRVTNPLLGVIPRRLVGALGISFVVAGGLMLMWGRLHADDPTALETFARITVIWAAAAFGATLGDILPGESTGEDISDLVGDRAGP
ncbi:MAG: DUF2391 family protein [Halobacteriota archaeon]